MTLPWRSDAPSYGHVNRVIAATRRAGTLPLSIAVLALPAVVAVVRLLLAARHPFDLYGDEAILEAAVRHLGEQLVGPYSRFGFHQPGPSYYYLQAPFYRLVGGSAAGLFLGAFCINLGAALGTVLVVRRALGETAARWAAVLVGVMLTCFTPALLANPWNPYVLALPVLLTVVLAAAAGGGSPAAAGGAVVVGSYVVQTHLATAPALAAMGATAGVVGAGLVAWSWESTSPDPPRLLRPTQRDGVALGAAAVVLVMMWAPPLVEQATRSPGNLTKLAQFFRASHPESDRGVDHDLGRTTGHVAAELTLVPFGHDREAQPTHQGRVAVAVAGVLAAAAVAVAGWRHRRATVAALGAISVVGPMAAIWSGTRIVGEVFPYLLVWSSTLLLPGAIGAGTLWLARHRKLVAAAAIGIGLSLTWTMARHPLVPYATAADVGATAHMAGPWLAEHGARTVRIRIAQHDRWPLATGLAVRLEKDGLKTTVDQDWTFLFGDHFRPTGNEMAEVWVADATAEPPDAARLIKLGTAGGASVWAGPMSNR